MAISKVILNGVTQMDVTQDTVTAQTLLQNETATGADGELVVGAYVAPTARTEADVTVSGATVTIPSGAYASQVQKSVASGTAGTPTATKGTVSNHSVSITPSVTNTTGYITGGTKTGTAVNVSASELVSGTKSITENGTGVDVTNYASVDVNVSGGLDMPTFTVTWSDDFSSILSITCDETFLEVYNRADSGEPTVLAFMQNNTMSATYLGYLNTLSETYINYFVYGGTTGSFDIIYTSNGSITYTLPSSNCESLNITANGTYTPISQYGIITDVNVNVPSTTINPLSVTANGTYTAPSGTAYSPVTVNVSGGGGSAEGGVRFYDYEGTLLHSYSVSEFNALTAMPSNPSHTGLIAQGWNWSLADAKAYLAKYPEGILNIGQNYTTDTGDTRVYIYIDPDTPANRMTFYFRFTSSEADNATVDWGDGTVETLGSTTATNYPHTYSTTGSFTIKLTVNSGTVSFVGTNSSETSGYCIYGDRVNSNSYNRGRIRAVEIGDNVRLIGQSYFFSCYSLETVSLPSTITSIGNYAFNNCYSLTSITIPDGVTSIGTYAFGTCYSLTSVTIPDGVTSIGTYAFSNCRVLTSITIPNGVTSIGNYAFAACHGMSEYHFLPTTPPSLSNTNAFSNIPSDCKIYVPQGSLEAYQTATNWSTYASHMVEESA